MLQPLFKSAGDLAGKTDAYFSYIEGEYLTECDMDDEPSKKATKEKKVCIREAEPPTLSGLAYYLGFNNRQDFFDYEQSGRFTSILKRARLRIEVAYEKKLHHQSPTGAIFALKSMGWNDKADDKADTKETIKNLIIEVIETGPKPAGSEKEVAL